ncbi:MAG: tRNA pseudouridine(38-40) synthase TruA [Phycisphaerae bacterium]|nr:tRNA pseudouridine(38-40) synthase TruA [Saprospiraceae bacterium]
MAKFKLTLEYDGSRYSGWQLQKNERSIQGELLQAAAKIFENQAVEIYGAGRTDAGVHARGQVAHLEVAETRLPPEQIMMRLNDELGHAINILQVEKAHPKFHARHDARSRSYTYQISKRRDAFGKKYVWWVRDPLDLRAMREAAARLEGFHDFRSFGATEKEDQSTLVDLDRVEIIENGDRIYIHITASHFLWKMVRRMVGVLVEVGRGKMTGQELETFLKTNSREPARFTAPPSGLFLERVEY